MDGSDPGALYEEMARLEREGEPFALATIVTVGGSSPRHLGARILVRPDGSTMDTIGGGGLEKRVIEDALKALSANRSSLEEYKLLPAEQGGIGAECGGDTRVFIEVHGDRPRLVLFGGGHVGLALARAANWLGFAVTVVDPREAFSRPERFPAGTATIHADPSDPETAACVPENAIVVILTHDHALDKAVLGNVLPRKPAYLGMIGSRRKSAAILKDLQLEGTPKEDLERVFAPIGLDIGAETPEEIALSILAEIVHVRKKGEASTASLGRRAADAS